MMKSRMEMKTVEGGRGHRGCLRGDRLVPTALGSVPIDERAVSVRDQGDFGSSGLRVFQAIPERHGSGNGVLPGGFWRHGFGQAVQRHVLIPPNQRQDGREHGLDMMTQLMLGHLPMIHPRSAGGRHRFG